VKESLDLIVYWAIVGLAYARGYYQRYRERELRAAQLEALLARAELQALKLQLHPHFLFNALHAVAGLVRRGENADAVRMIAGLSDLLRYVLDSADRQLVPLAEELAFLERYLDVQRLRFGDRLSAEIDAAPDTLGLEVPILILQPLVENALEHGLARRAGPGHLRLTARREEDRLVLRLRDDGRGLAGGADGGEGTGDGAGVGLENSRARLRELYGEGSALTLRDAEGGPGAVAELILPARPAAGESAA
jgi:two-component system, LytTR family, sensor kinase